MFRIYIGVILASASPPDSSTGYVLINEDIEMQIIPSVVLDGGTVKSDNVSSDQPLAPLTMLREPRSPPDDGEMLQRPPSTQDFDYALQEEGFPDDLIQSVTATAPLASVPSHDVVNRIATLIESIILQDPPDGPWEAEQRLIMELIPPVLGLAVLLFVYISVSLGHFHVISSPHN